jgi:FAD:protein FMN transferase
VAKNPLPIALGLLFVVACAPKTISLTRSRLMMGHVPVNVTIRTSIALKEKALETSEEAYALAQRIEGKISEYQPNSEITCLNREAGKAPCEVSPETLELLRFGVSLSDQTDHALDLRFGSASSAGRKGPIRFMGGKRVFLSHPDTQIGVGSIGKGMILDAMIDLIRSKGFEAALVDAGGDLRALGGPWKVAIQKPGAPPGKTAAVFEITDQALATSGNYEQPGHIRDPRTGEKVFRDQSVTVIADRHVLANALSTAFYVLGERESLLYIKKFPGIRVIWTDPTGQTRSYPP